MSVLILLIHIINIVTKEGQGDNTNQPLLFVFTKVVGLTIMLSSKVAKVLSLDFVGV